MTLDFYDRHAAFLAGMEYGLACRIEVELEDLVQARLHQLTREAIGMAKRSARHGPEFSQLVRESGERE